LHNCNIGHGEQLDLIWNN